MESNHIHFMYVSAISNVTTGNSTNNGTMCFDLCLKCKACDYGATTVVKISLFCTWTRSTVRFHSI